MLFDVPGLVQQGQVGCMACRTPVVAFIPNFEVEAKGVNI
jgi:hypothetical protein